MLSDLAEAGHQCTVQTRMVAPGGKRLKDHWESAESQTALQSQHWDYVVLQDQSTLGVNYYLEGQPRVTSDRVFLPYATKWAAAIRQHGARTLFFLTWARKKTPDDHKSLDYAYAHAARVSASKVAPVGLAWQGVRELDPALELYYKDGSHPSPAGSYLAACVLYATLFHHSPVGLPSRLSGPPVNLETEQLEPGKQVILADLPTHDAELLQKAAWRAISDFAAQWQKIASVAPADPVPALPPGGPLSALEGAWRGKMLFYPGVGPVELALTFKRIAADSPGYQGHLQIEYPVRDFATESFDLFDLKVGPRSFTFSDPKSAGVNNWRIDFRGERVGGELRGTAMTRAEGKEGIVTVLGSWTLHKTE